MAKNNKKFTYAVGRRRSASARVRLFKGKGQNMVNDLPIEKYFSGKADEIYWSAPFTLTDTEGKYYITAKVLGGGKQGQLDAVIHGIARAFVKKDKDKFRKILKGEGLLTRDARIRERRKVGMGGKARRKRQSPKR